MNDASDLLEELNKLVRTKKSISVLHIYQLGVVLDQSQVVARRNTDTDLAVVNLRNACQDILRTVPTASWKAMESALIMVLSNREEPHKKESLGSMAQLYRLSDSRYPPSSLLNDALLPNVRNPNLDRAIKTCLVEFLVKETDFEVFLPVICDLQELPFWNEVERMLTDRIPGGDWKECILSNFEGQRDYLDSILNSKVSSKEDVVSESEAIGQAVSSVQAPATNKSTSTKPAVMSPEQELQRRIKEVRDVCPTFGEGFIEAALSQFQGDVEVTVAALLDEEGNWPSALRNIDRTLPRRHRVSESLELDSETRSLLKANINATLAKEEKDAYLLEVAMKHDEYNDDYDDQYDDINDEAGNVDQPDDYEAIRVYNRALKGIVSEEAFWDENRNTNRDRKPAPKSQEGQTKSGDEDDDDVNQNGDDSKQEKKYRGPDKGRGGRIPGRGRGGRGGRGRSTAPGEQGDSKPTGGKPNLKSKQRKLDKRREKQKQAQQKRVG